MGYFKVLFIAAFLAIESFLLTGIGPILFLLIPICLLGMLKLVSDFNAKNLERQREYEKLCKDIDKHINDLKNSIKNKNNKWNSLDQSIREKILKVRVLVTRGEGGEKEAAKSRLDVMMRKHGLVSSDIPK